MREFYPGRKNLISFLPSNSILSLRTDLHNDTSLKPDSLADSHVGADNDVRTDDGCRVDFGRGVNENVALVNVRVLRRQCEQR